MVSSYFGCISQDSRVLPGGEGREGNYRLSEIIKTPLERHFSIVNFILRHENWSLRFAFGINCFAVLILLCLRVSLGFCEDIGSF